MVKRERERGVEEMMVVMHTTEVSRKKMKKKTTKAHNYIVCAICLSVVNR